jgi:serine/threonine-protein kinase
MAEVHRGRDTRLGRSVAVKLLRSDLARDPSFQSRFRREAQSAASLNHPNIVAVYDTGEEAFDGDPSGSAQPYIVMELVEGETLRDLVRSGRRVMPQRVAEIGSGILAALDYSHRHGIVHRDIKPGNVMLTTTGQVKVMDFGIARAVADSAATMTQTSSVLGTAQYLSPEQARGEKVDARSDLYSTGCLLYELLVGQPPFTGDSPVAVAYQHVRENPVPPSQLDPDLPAGYDAVILTALAKDPADRYQTAAEMKADLDRLIVGEAPARVAAPVAVPVAADATQLIPATTPVAETQAQRRAGWYVLLTLGAVAALALVFFLATQVLGGGGTKVRVPDLTGQTLELATATLSQKGLEIGAVTTETSEQVKDTVISQNPLTNAEVEPGTAVDVVVSSGPAQVPVPTLVGLSRAEALNALTSAGLTLGSLDQKASDLPADTVLSSDPPEDTLVDEGSAVSLVVSSGKVKVPDVRGETEAQAKADLGNAGFNVVVITQEDGSVDAGTVLAQSPSGGTFLGAGKTVTITVATEPPPPSPPASETASPTVSPSDDG